MATTRVERLTGVPYGDNGWNALKGVPSRRQRLERLTGVPMATTVGDGLQAVPEHLAHARAGLSGSFAPRAEPAFLAFARFASGYSATFNTPSRWWLNKSNAS